jgi:pimeloyl-ACP methyl ester carboxylesterase
MAWMQGELITFSNHKKETLRGFFERAPSSTGVIFAHGFGRTSMEPKFKNIADKLEGKVNLFRFDFSGCGLSGGSFEDITADKLAKELSAAVLAFRERVPRLKSIRLVSHSFACAAAIILCAREKDTFDKIVFLGPALNMGEILKYSFTRRRNPGGKITWANYRKFFDARAFSREMRKGKQMTYSHYISNLHYLENKDRDYRELMGIIPKERLLIVQGDNDRSIPLESQGNHLKNFKAIIVKGGDHDLERPDVVAKYLPQTVSFLTS